MANIEGKKTTDTNIELLELYSKFTLRHERKIHRKWVCDWLHYTTPKPSTPIICLKVLALLLPKVQKKMCVLQCIKMKGKGM